MAYYIDGTKIKYEVVILDSKGIEHILYILADKSDNPTAEKIRLDGNMTLSYNIRDNMLDTIVGSELQINLIATRDRNLSDLVGKYDKEIRVYYLRAGEIVFNGYLSADGWYEDMVRDTWEIQMYAIDGLGMLDNIKMTQSDGKPYRGTKRIIETVADGLKKVTELDIYVDVRFFYDGMTDNRCVFMETKIRTSSFESDEDFKSVGDVFRGLLRVFGAVIQQHMNGWYIYRPIDVARTGSLAFYRFDKYGVPLYNVTSPSWVTFNVDVDLGSHINGFYPHHISENQNLSYKRSLGILKYNFDYNYIDSLVSNNDLKWDTGGTSVTYWNFVSGNILMPADGYGIYTLSSNTDSTKGGFEISNTSSAYGSPGSHKLLMKFAFDISNSSIQLKYCRFIAYNKVKIKFTEDASGDVYTVTNDNKLKLGTGSVIDETISINLTGGAGDSYAGEFTFTREIESDMEGTWQIESIISSFELTPPSSSVGGLIYTAARELISVDLIAANDLYSNETITIEKNTNKNASTEDIIQVGYADGKSSTLKNLLLKVNEIPTSGWGRNRDATESIYAIKPIMEWAVERSMAMKSENSMVYSGSVYGYVPMMSRVIIDGITGKIFMPKQVDYNVADNITELKLQEVHYNELDDYTVKTDLIFTNPEEPKITE